MAALPVSDKNMHYTPMVQIARLSFSRSIVISSTEMRRIAVVVFGEHVRRLAPSFTFA